MSNNNAVKLGVEAFNKANQAVVEQQAVALIRQIRCNQGYIAANEKSIDGIKKQHDELAEDVVTQKRVLGTEFTGPLNPNQQTIVNAIKALNDANQEAVKVNSQGFINSIKSLENTNASYRKSNEELMKQLNALSVDVVTVEAVTPSSK